MLVAVAGLLAVGACQRDDSILLVTVAGDVTLPVAQLGVTVSADRTSRNLAVPAAPTAVTLPTSFTVELDRSITGPVSIAIDALDASGYTLGSGYTALTHINTGGVTIMTVMIESVTPP